MRELIQDLVQENLVVASENSNPALGSFAPEQKDKLPYELPKLNIYRDMGDLLALDPPVPGLGDTPVSWRMNPLWLATWSVCSNRLIEARDGGSQSVMTPFL